MKKSILTTLTEKDFEKSKIQNIWWAIYYPFLTFFCNIKNLIKWFPIIWKDRDWGHYYIFNILKFKLQNQRNYLCSEKSYRIEEDQNQIKRDINICLSLIDKICEKTYLIEYSDYHKTEWEWLDCEKPGFRELKIKELSQNFDEYFKKNLLTHKKVLKYLSKNSDIYNDISNLTLQARLISQFKQEKAHNLLFKILNERIEGWWD